MRKAEEQADALARKTQRIKALEDELGQIRAAVTSDDAQRLALTGLIAEVQDLRREVARHRHDLEVERQNRVTAEDNADDFRIAYDKEKKAHAETCAFMRSWVGI